MRWRNICGYVKFALRLRKICVYVKFIVTQKYLRKIYMKIKKLRRRNILRLRKICSHVKFALRLRKICVYAKLTVTQNIYVGIYVSKNNCGPRNCCGYTKYLRKIYISEVREKHPLTQRTHTFIYNNNINLLEKKIICI